MIGRVLRTGAVLLVAIGVTAACGSSDRPEEIAVDDVQPCQLISSEELQELPSVNGPHLLADIVDGGGLEGSTCKYPVAFGTNPSGVDNNVEVSTITNHGVDWQVDGPFESRTVTEVSDVRDFHTVRVWRGEGTPDKNDACSLYVDVAEEQALRVQVDESHDEDDPATCRTARGFAAAAIKGLETA